MKIELRRTKSTKQGTFGIMYLNDKPLCVTCEDPWEDNARNVSCIPTGTYICKKYTSPYSPPKYKNIWQVMDVPHRKLILIHNGNTIEDTEGCILVGESFAQFGFLPGINNSVKTLKMLQAKLPDEFILEIS